MIDILETYSSWTSAVCCFIKLLHCVMILIHKNELYRTLAFSIRTAIHNDSLYSFRWRCKTIFTIFLLFVFNYEVQPDFNEVRVAQSGVSMKRTCSFVFYSLFICCHWIILLYLRLLSFECHLLSPFYNCDTRFGNSNGCVVFFYASLFLFLSTQENF